VALFQSPLLPVRSGVSYVLLAGRKTKPMSEEAPAGVSC